MKKTLSILLAVLMLACMIPTFAVFAEEDKFATIDTAAEFDEFTKAVNAGTYTLAEGTTVKVTADLDMRDITDFQSINMMSGVTIDFDGHTVSNLVVTTNGASYKNGSTDPSLSNQRFAGIIVNNAKNGSAVLNLKLNNCQLNANARRIGMVAGYVERSVVNNITVENCTLKATHVGDTSSRYVAGVAACIDYSNAGYVLNASVNNLVIEADASTDHSAAIVGSLWKGEKVTTGEISATNVTAKKAGAAIEVAVAGTDNGYMTYPTEIKVENTTTATGYTTPAAPAPETPVKPAPTGDMTVALVAVALVSLAAVTVIAKKKVTE